MQDHLTLVAYPAGEKGKPSCCLACVYEVAVDRFRVVSAEDIPQLRQRLLQADWVSGFALYSEGLPCIFETPAPAFLGSPTCRMLQPRTTDLQEKVVLALKQQPGTPGAAQVQTLWTLEAASAGTIDRKPVTTQGVVAERLRRGDWATAANFALEDCALVRDLLLFESRYGYLVHARSGARLVTRHAGVRPADTFGDPLQMLRTPASGGGIPFQPLPAAQVPVSAEAFIPPDVSPEN